MHKTNPHRETVQSRAKRIIDMTERAAFVPNYASTVRLPSYSQVMGQLFNYEPFRYILEEDFRSRRMELILSYREI